jgi:ADP-ribose pyrophosphatase YjhB (NUDIX family)
MADSYEDGLLHARVVAGVVIKKDGKYLLVQEKQEKVHGKWNLPAGHVDKGETLEQAAIREAKEESGLNVKLGKHLLVVHQSADRPVLHAFAAEIISGELVFPQDELLDARWFTYDEIVTMKDDLRNIEYILGAIDAARN